jgi:hypothetical protein
LLSLESASDRGGIIEDEGGGGEGGGGGNLPLAYRAYVSAFMIASLVLSAVAAEYPYPRSSVPGL